MYEKSAAYQPPTITVIGTVEGVTAGAQNGSLTDRFIPINTPKPVITFSH